MNTVKTLPQCIKETMLTRTTQYKKRVEQGYKSKAIKLKSQADRYKVVDWISSIGLSMIHAETQVHGDQSIIFTFANKEDVAYFERVVLLNLYIEGHTTVSKDASTTTFTVLSSEMEEFFAYVYSAFDAAILTKLDHNKHTYQITLAVPYTKTTSMLLIKYS
tara:strand:- start:3776 stop:4261 length:486 start_codon:yes stop_codon:yes gene_type:complete